MNRRAKRRLPVVEASTLPPHQAAWISAILSGPIPAEPHATCGDCAMLPAPGDAHDPQGHFDPTTKCCTYLPALPNFLVGSILLDRDADGSVGRERIRARIRQRVAVSPLGIGPPPQFARLYHAQSGAFGRTPALRCPYYDEERKGACSIWRYRNGVCSSWFCKHERGGVGERFWRAIEHVLLTAEREIARHCVVELDVGIEALGALFPHPGDAKRGAALGVDDVEGRVNERTHRTQWGTWLGREEAFFEAAAALASGLCWADVASLAGPELAALVRVVRAQYETLVTSRVPERLVVGTFEVRQMRADVTRVVTYSTFDPIDLPTALVAALPAFDGGPTARALRRIERRDHLSLDAALLGKLVDFGLLEPC